MNKEKSCGAVVINDKKEILLVRSIKGYYGFPKGHVEKNETEIETAQREVKEETNIDIEIISSKKFILTYKMDNNIEKDVILFLAKPINYNLKPQDGEISDVRWVAIDKVDSYFEFDNIKNLWNNEIKPEVLKNKIL